MLYYTENFVLHRQDIDDYKLFKKFLTVLILWSFNVEVHVWATFVSVQNNVQQLAGLTPIIWRFGIIWHKYSTL